MTGPVRSIRTRLLLGMVTAVMILGLQFPGSTASAQADLDRQVKDIEAALICQCGCTMVVNVCECGTAEEMRAEIREALLAGKTRKQILDDYVARYGETVLAAPEAKGFNITAWVLPFVALLVGAGLVVFLVRAWVGRYREEALARPRQRARTEEEERYARKVEEDLKKYL